MKKMRDPLRRSAIPPALLLVFALSAMPVAAGELDEINGLIQRSDWVAAETQLQSMLDLHPDYAYGHSLRGHVLMRDERIQAFALHQLGGSCFIQEFLHR